MQVRSTNSVAKMVLCINTFNTLKPRQYGHHFADDIFKCIFLKENAWISYSNAFLCMKIIYLISDFVAVCSRRTNWPVLGKVMTAWTNDDKVHNATKPQWVKGITQMHNLWEAEDIWHIWCQPDIVIYSPTTVAIFFNQEWLAPTGLPQMNVIAGYHKSLTNRLHILTKMNIQNQTNFFQQKHCEPRNMKNTSLIIYHH